MPQSRKHGTTRTFDLEQEKRMMKRIVHLLAIAAFATTTFGCATGLNQNAGVNCKEETMPGMAIGGIAGALIGAALDGTTGGLIGGLAGVIVGGVIGDYREDQCYREEFSRVNAERDELAAMLAACEEESARLAARVAELEAMPRGGQLARYTLGSDVLFEPGRDVLSASGRRQLDEAIRDIMDRYPGQRINIEGHTDADPIRHSRWKSNWELGAARALTVLHYLEDHHGVEGRVLSATTFAHHQPVADNDTAGGKAQNRRSSIVIYASE
jgi:flagellar motor protein MotB